MSRFGCSLLATLLALAACAEDKADAKPDTAQADPMVGYDLRRLRPVNEEPLEAMFERVFARAGQDGKRVGVLFSADWCEPCRVLDTELGGQHPQSAIGHVRILELKEEDWEAVTRMDEFNGLRGRWHKTLNSYPVLVLLDQHGNKVEEMKEAIERLETDGVEPTLPNWFASHGQSQG